jgi:predicted transposase/invertase (TIGR01784 family)
MHTDPLFFRLFQERPELAFDLAGLTVPEASAYRMKAVEVKQTAFRLDGVLLPPPERTDAPLIFAEAQFQGRPTFYARWLASIFLYLYRERISRPWLAVVVFPDRPVDTGIITPYEGLIGCGLLRRVYLSDLLEAEHLGFNARLARLIILDQAQAAAEARALAAHRDRTADPLETLDLIETILVYKFPQLTREEIRAMLHLPVTDVKKTRSYQEAFGEGREEGREEARRELVLRLLARRCGTLLPPHLEKIRALDGEQLGALGDALLDFGSIEDLDTWLMDH